MNNLKVDEIVTWVWCVWVKREESKARLAQSVEFCNFVLFFVMCVIVLICHILPLSCIYFTVHKTHDIAPWRHRLAAAIKKAFCNYNQL